MQRMFQGQLPWFANLLIKDYGELGLTQDDFKKRPWFLEEYIQDMHLFSW